MPEPEILITDPHGCFRIVRSRIVMPGGEYYFNIESRSGGGSGEWEKVNPWTRWDALAVQLLAAELYRIKNPVTVTDEDGEAD